MNGNGGPSMKLKKIFSAMLVLALASTLSSPVHASDSVSIRATMPYTASILGTDLWRADIPTSILMTDKFSGYLRFPVTAVAPFSILADKAFGVDVEFELWTVGGKKLGDRTIYSFGWNPVSSQTQVEIYLRAEDMKGSAVLRIRTEQTRSTTGLLSRYVETVANFNVSLSQGTPPAAPTLNWSNWSQGRPNFTISIPQSTFPITRYDVYVRKILSDDLSPTTTANYGEASLLKSVTSTAFEISPTEMKLLPGSFDKKYALFSLKAVSEVGESDFGKGVYIESRYLLPLPGGPQLNPIGWTNGTANYSISVPQSSLPISRYDVYVRKILSDNLSPSTAANYGEALLLKSVTSTVLQISQLDMQLVPGWLDSKYVLISVKAVNEVGEGDFGLGVYSESRKFLGIPDPTPSIAAPKPTTPVKYKNCAAMNKIYSGGVAKSNSSVNKGSKLKLRPVVNSKAYELNKGLDKDRDGLACER